MKKVIIAAIAATMASVSMADISIKGDATFEYANKKAKGTTSGDNTTRQRVRLHVTGKSGDTTVKLGLRNDGKTRVSGGTSSSENATGTGSNAGIVKAVTVNATSNNSAQLNVDYLYLTTKIGALNIKAGDWWDTTGLGVARKGKADADRVEFSTKVGGWKLGLETGADSKSTVLSANGKIAGFDVKFEHNTAVSVDGNAVNQAAVKESAAAITTARETYAGVLANAATTPAELATAKEVLHTTLRGRSNTNDTIEKTIGIANEANGFDAQNNGKYTDISVKGKIGAIGIAAEYFSGTNDTRGALGLGSAADAKVIHVWTKAADITWHAAWANSEAGVAGITGSGNKFSPLGVSILATAPGVNGNVAIGNFGNAGQEDEVYGIRADTKLAGMGVQFAVGNLILGKGATFDGKDAANDTFVDLIVTRKLGSGSNIKFSAGKYNNTRSFGTTVSVKF